MRSQNKGFDPLSSLFAQASQPPASTTDKEHPPVVEEAPAPAVGRDADHVELTDPHYKMPEPIEPVAVAPVADVEAPQPEVGAASAEAPDVKKPAPAEPAVSAEERAAIARAIGKAAAAKAAANAAAAKAAAPPPAPVVPPAAPSAQKAPPRSRLDTLSSRSRRPVSAAEALRIATAAESRKATAAESRKTAATATSHSVAAAPSDAGSHAPALTLRVAELVKSALPTVGAFSVANAIVADQRAVLTAIWRGHRAKFLRDDQIGRAVGAVVVLRALEQVTAGQLVVALVVTEASDYLVWMDMGNDALLAAFSDARAYFAGAQ